MDWKVSFQRIGEEKQRIEGEKERERIIREEGALRAKSILPQVKEVVEAFAEAIHLGTSVEVTQGGLSFKMYGYKYWGDSGSFRVDIVVHPFCSVCAKEIIGGDYVRVEMPDDELPEKIKFTYPVVRACHRDTGYGVIYRHDPGEFIKIPFKDFTKEKLAKVLADIYVAMSGERHNKQ